MHHRFGVDVRGGYHPQAEPHVAALGGGLPVSLRGRSSLALVVTIHYRIVEYQGTRGPWKVSTAAYVHELLDARMTKKQKNTLAYHWHPAWFASDFAQ